jgi:hypothetical protein
MKKILFIKLFLLCINSLVAQQTNNLAKEAKQTFEGCWTGVVNNDTITLVLLQTSSMMEKIQPVDSIVYLYGWHKISNNDKIIENSLNSKSYDLDKGFTIILSYKAGRKSFDIGLRDITRNRLLEGRIEVINVNEFRLTTWLKEVWRNDNKKYPDGQTFPKVITMRRISK